MKKAYLLSIIFLFCVFSFFPSQASMQDRGSCVKACNTQNKADRAHCKSLKGKARSECMKAAKELMRSCKAACPKDADDDDDDSQNP